MLSNNRVYNTVQFQKPQNVRRDSVPSFRKLNRLNTKPPLHEHHLVYLKPKGLKIKV